MIVRSVRGAVLMEEVKPVGLEEEEEKNHLKFL